MKNFFKEFREFAMRGNVVDLAVAVVLGAAFTGIVTSFVNDIIMPLIGVLLGGVDISSLSITVGNAVIAYGKFLQAIVNFVIIAIVLFLVVRGINHLRSRMEAKKEALPPPPPAEDIVLLTQIRDLLKK
jgi:large conductance mechanosensitive channel